MKDQLLIRACKENSYQAQLKIYHQFKNLLFNAAYRILKNEQDAQDMVHDAFIKAFQRITQLEDEANLGGWLKRIAINCSLDLIKKKRKLSWMEDHPKLLPDYEEETYEIYPSIHQIMEGIAELKDKYRIVLILFLIEDYSHKEIAEMLAINETIVRNQYRRGRLQLKEILQKERIA